MVSGLSGLVSLMNDSLSHAQAPEVLSEGKQSRWADVYSFGITLWEMCSGQAPYRGLNHVALSQLVVCKHKRPTIPKDIPADLQILIERCWQPAPSYRPTFEAILLELQKIRSGIGGEAKPWPQSAAGDLSSEKLPMEGSQDRADLTEALFVSQISFVSLEGWTPVIMGDEARPSDHEARTSGSTSTSNAQASPKKISSVRDLAVTPCKISLNDLLCSTKTSSERLEKVHSSGVLPRPSEIKLMIASPVPPDSASYNPQTPPSFSDMIQIGAGLQDPQIAQANSLPSSFLRESQDSTRTSGADRGSVANDPSPHGQSTQKRNSFKSALKQMLAFGTKKTHLLDTIER